MRRLGPRLACAALVVLLACGDDSERPAARGRPGAPEQPIDPNAKELRELSISDAPRESDEQGLLSPSRPTLRSVIERIDAVRTDRTARGLFLRLAPLGGAFGRVSELVTALRAVRRAGKPVHCWFETIDNAGYMLAASSCDRITMAPAGDLDLVGVAAHLFYAKNLLDEIGVSADILQEGRFKGAADPFTRTDMPPEVRESLGALLDDLYASLLRAIVDGRHVSDARARELVDGGPYDGSGARTAGLVDGTAFDDEARALAKRAARADRVTKVDLAERDENMDLGQLLGALGGGPTPSTVVGPRIALVMLVGNIVDGEDETMGTVSSGPFVRALRRLAEDKDVKAVVLRIDSPGGSALASDRMWHAVQRVARRKPVIVSVGDMAASGGYYVASASREIWASDTSMVGSIGVVGGKVTFGALAERLGVHVEVLTRGRRAAWTSPARPFTDDERVVLRRMLHTTYERFLSRIGTGRGMARERILPGAEGRIMSGRRARALGLVDRAGGLGDALASARRRGHLPADAPIETWPARRTWLDAVASALGARQPDASTDHALEALRGALDGLGPLGRAAAYPLMLGRERAVVALPFVVEIR